LREPAPTPYRPLLWLAAAAGLGVAADYNLQTQASGPLFAWWWFASATCLLFCALARRQKYSDGAAAALLVAAAALGGAWHDWRWNFAPDDDLARFAGEEPQPTCVEVLVVDRVRTSPPADRSPLRAIPARTISETTVRVTAIRDGADWRPAGGLSRLRVAGQLPEVSAGDRAVVFAQMARPQPPLNPGEFDWSAAERRNGRLSELYCDNPRCVMVTDGAPRFDVALPLATIRGWCERQLSANVSPRDAPLVLATLLGDQERLSEETKDAFMKTGAIHLLVVSGAHIALLATIAWRLTGSAAMSRRMQVIVTVAAIGIYSAIVGAQPSVMRAAVLTIATIMALFRGRAASAGNIFGAAALFVILYNPGELFRAGTQFSFLAVAVLIAFSRLGVRSSGMSPLERLIDEARPWWLKLARRAGGWFIAMTVASLAVGVAMAPLVSYHFHVVTPASILLTPLAGPLVAIALAAGVAVVTIGWLVPPIGALCGGLCGGCLQATESLVMQAQSIPGSYFYTPGFPGWWLWGFYGVAALWIAIPSFRPRWHWQASAAMVWLAAMLIIPQHAESERQLRCTFLAVGHGTCAVMELPSGQTILYDAGSLGSPDAAAKIIASFLWSRGIERIDALVLSHPDIDHYNAVPELVERFPIGVVYVSPMMFDPLATLGDLTAPNYLHEVLNRAGVPQREVWLNDRVRTDDADVVMTVLHPPREGVLGRDNANSVLLSVEYAGKRLLLPGDLEPPGLDLVMSDPPLDCDILLAPHHGSGGSDPPGFAAWCTPEHVVLSGERSDRTAAAQESYQRVGAAVYHTALDGAVSFVLTSSASSGQQAACFRERPNR
jgi:competence protein ComEC